MAFSFSWVSFIFRESSGGPPTSSLGGHIVSCVHGMRFVIPLGCLCVLFLCVVLMFYLGLFVVSLVRFLRCFLCLGLSIPRVSFSRIDLPGVEMCDVVLNVVSCPMPTGFFYNGVVCYFVLASGLFYWAFFGSCSCPSPLYGAIPRP